MAEPDEIEKRVQAALHVDSRTAQYAEGLQVCGVDGGVELRGTVEDLAMLRRAERVAQEVAAGTPIHNAIELVPYPPRQDGQITDHLNNALAEDPNLRASEVRVAVQDGHVRLEGVADSQISKRLVEATCWWVPGVRSVDNRMAVDHPEADLDWIVLESIHVVFSKDWLLSGSNIMFSSRDGVVRLTGTVSAPELVRAAENDVWAIEGVKDVINDLQVQAEYPLESTPRYLAS